MQFGERKPAASAVVISSESSADQAASVDLDRPAWTLGATMLAFLGFTVIFFLLAYLFYPKDSDRFMPIAPTTFDAAFTDLAIALKRRASVLGTITPNTMPRWLCSF
jgi:hypothetical protein